MEAIQHWDPVVETMSRAELEALQGERLVRQVKWVYENSPFFRDLYRRHHVHPEDIHSLADLTKLPTISKDDLREWREKTGDPFCGALCVPQRMLVKVHHSTGTSGLPNVYGLTRKDWDDSADQFARILYRVGLRSGDKTNNWLESAMGWHGYTMTAEGARRIGATVFSLEPDNRSIAPTTLEMLKGVDLNAIFVYHPEIEISYLKKKQLVPKQIHPSLRFIYSAALTTPARRKLLEEAWGVPYYNMGASGDQYLVGSECPYSKPGLHMLEDRSIIEVLDPVTHEPVPDGQIGEVTVTNLWAEAVPYIRYRLEDIAFADRRPCTCGSTHVRLIYRGRMAWSVLVEGQRIFSDDVENILWQFPETQFAQYQLVRFAQQPQPRLIVRTTFHRELASNEHELRAQLTAALQDQLGVPCEVRFVEPGDIGIGTVKFQRVLEVNPET
jgi:phenylacetate-CoA ligase